MSDRYANRNPYPFHGGNFATHGQGYRPAPQKARVSTLAILARIIACCAVSSGVALVLIAYFYA